MVRKAVLIGAVPPLMLKTDANPGGLPKHYLGTIFRTPDVPVAKFAVPSNLAE
jgi:hypothetical protein